MIQVEAVIYLNSIEVEAIVQMNKIGVEVETLMAALRGKSAYQSYLDTTYDDPPLTEMEWANLITSLHDQIDDLRDQIQGIEAQDPIMEYNTYLLFPNVGRPKTIYLDKATSYAYRWNDEEFKYYQINEVDVINGGN